MGLRARRSTAEAPVKPFTDVLDGAAWADDLIGRATAS
jgi:hypothetical protein